MAIPEAEALSNEAWSRSARPQIKRLVESVVTVANFLEIVATSPRASDLGPALDHLEFSIESIRRATNTPRGS